MMLQRPLAAVPRWIPIAFAAFLVLQVAWKAGERPSMPSAEDLPPAPKPQALRLVALGETATLARLAMLYLQSFDYHGTNSLPYRKLDYSRLISWLGSIQALDPRNDYPLFAAARIYAEVPDARRQRMMLEFIFNQFQEDPDRRWQWAAHGALVAKHRLKDLPLALRYASAIDRLTSASDIPLWARQMSIFILEDMNELEAARVVLGGLLVTGKIKDVEERRFLEDRLKKLEEESTPPSR
jgi:hypothetical protein